MKYLLRVWYIIIIMIDTYEYMIWVKIAIPKKIRR